MKSIAFLAALSAALFVAACSATPPPPPGGSGEANTAPSGTPDPTAAPTGSPGGLGSMCGGFGALPCAKGLICKDDPSDSCDPAGGGRDCSGICVADPGPGGGGGACDKPERKYVAKDPQKCAAIRFFCEVGYVAFHDDCGCGCEPGQGQPPPQGQPCKDKVCGADQFCCNPSCGICAPKGGACTQQVCN